MSAVIPPASRFLALLSPPKANLFQFNEYRSIQLPIAEPLPGFFPPEHDNRLDLVGVQFVSVVQDRRSAPSVGQLHAGRFVVELDHEAHSGRRRRPVFNEHNGTIQLTPRRDRRSVSAREEDYRRRA